MFYSYTINGSFILKKRNMFKEIWIRIRRREIPKSF
jgi:hypothetical protein